MLSFSQCKSIVFLESHLIFCITTHRTRFYLKSLHPTRVRFILAPPFTKLSTNYIFITTSQTPRAKIHDHFVMSDSGDPLSAAARRYSRAASRNCLGDAAERRSKSKLRRFLAHLWHYVPWQLMLAQLLWTLLVVFVFVLTSWDNATIAFLRTHLVAPSGVVHALGWGLFVLLAFYVSLGASRYERGATCIISLKAVALPLARCIHIAYRRGKWHDGDYDRLVAHLAAFPICVKMHLCGERDEDQLKPLLSDDDIKEIFAIKLPFMRCLYVILAYFSDPVSVSDYPGTSDDDQRHSEEYASTEPPASTVHLVQARCAIDMAISLAPSITVTKYAPAKPYIATLIAVSLLWFALLPLGLVQTCRE